MCTSYIASERYPSLPHLFTILCPIICFLLIILLQILLGKQIQVGDSSKQIVWQEYFKVAFKAVEPTEKYKFLFVYAPCHKKKKLYPSLAFKTLKIQFYDSSIDIIRLMSKEQKILSCFVTLLKNKKKYSPGMSKRTNIQHICKELYKAELRGKYHTNKARKNDLYYSSSSLQIFDSFSLSLWCNLLKDYFKPLSFSLIF